MRTPANSSTIAASPFAAVIMAQRAGWRKAGSVTPPA